MAGAGGGAAGVAGDGGAGWTAPPLGRCVWTSEAGRGTLDRHRDGVKWRGNRVAAAATDGVGGSGEASVGGATWEGLAGFVFLMLLGMILGLIV